MVGLMNCLGLILFFFVFLWPRWRAHALERVGPSADILTNCRQYMQ